ncbi:hypothetical protein AAG570_013491 [Ranatra chinensis]|uniref:Uncharacterized protein n=1 Tax=Ranatra chinensis TaxID=642074 RepID=A0ABD0YCH7_9HEMI
MASKRRNMFYKNKDKVILSAIPYRYGGFKKGRFCGCIFAGGGGAPVRHPLLSGVGAAKQSAGPVFELSPEGESRPAVSEVRVVLPQAAKNYSRLYIALSAMFADNKLNTAEDGDLSQGVQIKELKTGDDGKSSLFNECLYQRRSHFLFKSSAKAPRDSLVNVQAKRTQLAGGLGKLVKCDGWA